jgi:uncharacterized repeat protein (TIGR03803 family)
MMKTSRLLFLILFLLGISGFQSNAQQLWGIADSGGANGLGVIFKINLDGSAYEVVYSLSASTGFKTRGKLMRANDGFFYGTTQAGGIYGNGVIFRFNPYLNTYQALYHFDGPDGKQPFKSDLMQAKDGKIYGVAEAGGLYNKGVIFSFDPVENVYSKLHDFSGIDGNLPRSGLLQARNGWLYGTTYYGGSTYDVGVLFRFDPVGHIFTSLRSFNIYYEGSYPISNLLEGGNGRIYGAFSHGTNLVTSWIFSTDSLGGHFIDHRYTDGSNGSQIFSNIVQAPNGKIFGTTYQGGAFGKGTIIRADTAGGGHIPANLCTNLHNFNDTAGASGNGGLVLASNGMLYGLATLGGDFALMGGFGGGVLYRLDTATLAFEVLHVFHAASGYYPSGSLIETEVISNIREVSSEMAELQVFPNPGSGEFVVESQMPITELRVVDAQGKLVQYHFPQSTKLSFGLTRPGFYIAGFKCKDRWIVKKLVLMH